jgi:hypothetical protein
MIHNYRSKRQERTPNDINKTVTGADGSSCAVTCQKADKTMDHNSRSYKPFPRRWLGSNVDV